MKTIETNVIGNLSVQMVENAVLLLLTKAFNIQLKKQESG
jgi:hypothetical protein